MKSKDVILKELRKQPMSLQALKSATGFNHNGIRGRLSELKAMGFAIKLNKKTREYEYNPDSTDWTNRVEWMLVEEENFIRDNFFQMEKEYGRQITIEKLAKKFNRTCKKVTKKLMFMGMFLR